MFCPNCSQALQAQGLHECPTCGFRFTKKKLEELASLRVEPRDAEQLAAVTSFASSRVDAGVSLGVRLMLLAVVLLPVYKLLGWLYPANDQLGVASQSRELFETAGIAILLTLFVGGLLRAVYAITVERKKAIKEAAEVN